MDIKKIVFKNLDGSLRKVNIVNSINGVDIPDSGAVILDTVKDITTDGSSLTVTKSDGSTSKVTLNASGGVKSVNNVQPDSNGNVEIPVGSVKTVNNVQPDESGNVTIEAGKVKTVNNVQPDEQGNISIQTGTVKSVNNVQPDEEGNVALNVVKSINGNTPDINGNITIKSGGVTTVDGKAPDSNGNVSLNVVKSINGNTPGANGDVELDTISDITLSGKNLNIESTDGNTKTLVLPFSDVKTEINNIPDSEGNVVLSIIKSASVNSPINGNVTTEAGNVKTVNNIQPDENGNVALDCVQNVFVASDMMTVTTQTGTQQYDLRTEYSSSEQSTDDSQVITVNTKTRYHSITLNTSNSSIVFANSSATPTQLADNSESSGPEAPSTPVVPDMTSSKVIKLELFIKQGTGTNTVTWPSNVKWENGIEPVLSLEKDHVDLISLISLDNGQNYYGFAKAVWMN